MPGLMWHHPKLALHNPAPQLTSIEALTARNIASFEATAFHRFTVATKQWHELESVRHG